MASLSFTCPLTLPRGRTNCLSSIIYGTNILKLKDLRQQNLYVRAVSKKKASQAATDDIKNEEGDDNKTSKGTRKASRRIIKKISLAPVDSDEEVESIVPVPVTPADDSKKVNRRVRRKVTPASTSEEETFEKKVTKRRTRKRIDSTNNQSTSTENVNLEGPTSPNPLKGEDEDPHLREDDGDDISFSYGWPPLVCCFGAAQHAYIPSGRPANRLIDHAIHESMKGVFWSPAKFIRAPGGSSSSVAVALASLGGRVEFMGKLGDDEYGQQMLYHLNVNKVQTRSIKLDNSKHTAVSHMKIIRRGGLRMNCIKLCAEDNLLSSEINIDVLKEAKMFYFNSSSLLDQNMRSTTMQALEISKKFGGVIFFDLNLPIPLWKCSEETMAFIRQAWNHADIIEVTKQELEFLGDIESSETFDTKDNDKAKFIHHKPEVIMPLWHENLKTLFVTNGTSKIHYYTAKDNGWVHGMEDAPITPFTSDMSVSGDAIVAALMRMLTVQPHLATDKGYLEHTIKYAIDCGVIDQWLLARGLGFLPKTETEASSPDSDRARFVTETEYRTVGEAVVS